MMEEINNSDTTKLAAAKDIVCRLYDGARGEILQRMALRDRMMIVYIGALGVLFSFSIPEKGFGELIIIVPAISLATAAFTYHHSIALATYVAYVRLELTPWIERNIEKIPVWENSGSLKNKDSLLVTMRTAGEVFLFTFPSLVSLVLTLELHTAASKIDPKQLTLIQDNLLAAFYVNVVVFLLIIFATIYCHKGRIKLLKMRIIGK